MIWKDEFVVLDTETTGFSGQARVIEIGILHVVQGQTALKFAALVNPGEIDWEDPEVRGALEVSKISKAMLEKIPGMGKYGAILGGLLQQRTWVGHNIEFDERMLRQSWPETVSLLPCSTSLYPFPGPIRTLDTLLLDFILRPGKVSRKLASVCMAWGVSLKGEHRAMGDAMATRDILLKMLPKLPDDDLELHEMLVKAKGEWQAIMANRR